MAEEKAQRMAVQRERQMAACSAAWKAVHLASQTDVTSGHRKVEWSAEKLDRCLADQKAVHWVRKMAGHSAEQMGHKLAGTMVHQLDIHSAGCLAQQRGSLKDRNWGAQKELEWALRTALEMDLL